MNKARAVSPANIAFIKYWGKKNPQLNIPFNDSLSMNLDRCLTTTTVTFAPVLSEDRVIINRETVRDTRRQRVTEILDAVREKAGMKLKAKVVSRNNFPTAAGIASSASAFSALALAATKAAELNLSGKDLSILARLGSGSACRSMVDGFAWWKRGTSSQTSYAVQLAPPSHWQLRDIVVVVSKEEKKSSSTEGHEGATSSPYFKTRLRKLPVRTKRMKKTILEKNFEEFGTLVEEEAIDLHMIAMTSRPPIFYWNEGTVQVMNKVRQWRKEGLRGYFTMDAGANVHVVCLSPDEVELNRRLRRLPQVVMTIVNQPAAGARLL